MTFLKILFSLAPTVQGRVLLEEPELQVVQVAGAAPAHPVDTSDQRPVHGRVSNFDGCRGKRRKHNQGAIRPRSEAAAVDFGNWPVQVRADRVDGRFEQSHDGVGRQLRAWSW